MTNSMAGAAAVAVGVALLVGPAAAQAQPGESCHRYRAGTVLTVADNGAKLCVHRGQVVSVALSVDPAQYPDRGQWWAPIAESGRALRARPQTALPVLGTTLGRFQAVGRGRATLSSTRAVCPPNPDGPTCHSLQGWQVLVVAG